MAQNKFTEYVATIEGLTPTQATVLKIFAGFTDNRTGEGFPSLSTIAAGAMVARSTVQLAIDDLQEKGHLKFVRRRRTARGSVCVHRVVVPTAEGRTDSSRTDSRTDTDGRTDSVGTSEVSSNQPDSRTDGRTDTRTDRYRTDQVVSSVPVNRNETPTTKPELISTDAKTRGQELFNLTQKLWNLVGRPPMSQAKMDEWVEQSKALKDYDVPELTEAVKHAFTGDFWPKRIFNMSGVVKSADTILAQYARDKKQAKAGGEPESLQALRDKYPGEARSNIVKMEATTRVMARWQELIAACMKCDAKGLVPGISKKGRQLRMRCPECGAALDKFRFTIMDRVREEVYGKSHAAGH